MGKRRLQPRRQWFTIVVLLVLSAVGAGLAAVGKWQGAPAWIVSCAAGMTVVVGIAASLWQYWRERRVAVATVVRRSTIRPGKTIREISLGDLRVHPAVINIPYLPRAAKEREVGDHLDAGRPVLIVGPSMVGKTRLAAAAVTQVLPDKPILLPDTPSALHDLDEANIFPQQHVVWLDDFERFLTVGEVTAGLMRRLSESNWLVATLRAHELDRFQPIDQLRSPEWDVLRLFEVVWLDRDRDRPSDEELRNAVPQKDIRERIIQIGIGEYVGAAQRVRDQLMVGKDANPLGYALVMGAVDWSLVGITRPVPADLLPQLASPYLARRRRSEIDDREKYQIALDWATREINPTVSLLTPDGGTYRVYDFALEQLAVPDKTISVATWELAIREATSDELISVGLQAMMPHRNLVNIAVSAWSKAADAGHVAAKFNLGLLLQQRGKFSEAERLYRSVADGGDTNAMTNLGLVLQLRGESSEAERWLRKAADAGNAGAMMNLAQLLQERGDTGEAERWLRQAADAGIDLAAFNMGTLKQRTGDTVEAERWWRQAAKSGDTRAMFSVGLLQQRELGDSIEGERWYRRAAEAGDTRAMTNLGLLLQNRGKTTEAERWYRQAIAAGEIRAVFNMGTLLQQRGELPKAERWWRQAAEAGETRAMFNLGMLLLGQGDSKGAEYWWRKGSKAGDVRSMTNLGSLYHQRGELPKAERWWRQAAEAGETNAMVNLGLLHLERDELIAAERWWRQAADAGHRGSMRNLETLQREKGKKTDTEE